MDCTPQKNNRDLRSNLERGGKAADLLSSRSARQATVALGMASAVASSVGEMAIGSRIYRPVTMDIHAAAPIRQRCGPKLRPRHQGLRPPPNLALAGEIGGVVCRAAAPSPPFRPWFRRIRDRRSRRPSAAQRSVNKIIHSTSEPCVVLGSSRYLQSAAANAKEHAIASVLDDPL
jgi:hypothetical protein